MEDQDELIMRKSDNEGVGAEDDNKAVSTDLWGHLSGHP